VETITTREKRNTGRPMRKFIEVLE